MATVERTITAQQPVEKVWAYLSDFTNTEDWDPPTVRTTRTGGDGTVGTTYHNTSTFLGKETEVEYVVTQHVPNERLQLVGSAHGMRLMDTITFETDGTRTSGRYCSELQPEGALTLVEPLLPAGLKLLGDRVAGSLEEKLARL